MSHVEELLHDWFLGTLDASAAQRVDEHLGDCVACRNALDEHITLMVSASDVATARCPEELLGKATSLRRFERFAERIASLADVALETVKGWLSKIDDAAVWSETAMEQLRLFHIDGGPAVDDAIIGFVELLAGTSFPEHTHLGTEKTFIIQGMLRDENGDVHGPGELVTREAGTTHGISAEPGVPLLYLNIIHKGLELFGIEYGPDSTEF